MSKLSVCRIRDFVHDTTPFVLFQRGGTNGPYILGKLLSIYENWFYETYSLRFYESILSVWKKFENKTTRFGCSGNPVERRTTIILVKGKETTIADNMETQRWRSGGSCSRLVYKIGLFLLLVEVSHCLQITNLDVPQSYIIQRGDEPVEDLVLDCEFEMDEAKSKGFVLKWKHNSLQIYQWIPVTSKPVAFASFKGHIDLDYAVSDDRFQKYRALRLINPAANFTGNYSCSVQTFEENETKTGHLQIIVPEVEFNLTYTRGNNGSVVVSCGVSDIFPKPELALFIDESQTKEVVLSEEQLQGTYDMTLQHILSDDSKDAAISCQLSIPGTNYTKRREKMYHGAAFRANISILQTLVFALVAAVFSSSFRL